MNILIIAGYYPKPHNRVMGVWAHEQARTLQDRGNTVTVISPTPWLPKVFNLFNIPQKINDWLNVPEYENYDGVAIYNSRVLIWPQIKILSKIYNKFPIIKTSIVYANMSWKLKKIIKEEKIDIIHAHGPSFEGMIAYKISKKYNIPYCVTENSAWDPKFALKNKPLEMVYQKVLSNAACIISVSKIIQEEILKFGMEYKKKIKIVHPGVDINKVKENKVERPVNYKDNKVLLSVGAMEERKGHTYLIDSIESIYKDHPMLKCIIIGSFSTEGELLSSRIKEKGLSDVVELKGQLSHKEVLEYMSWCDIFVLPSWFEAFGVVYAEAMSLAKPIIGVQGEGISDVIDNGVNGILVPMKDAKGLSKEIVKLLSNETICNSIGESGSKTVENLLTWNYNAVSMEHIYNKCISSLRDKKALIFDLN
ncbi:glycosyltransferase [Paenibacillus sp. OV219]|uniref:glycosyltransferase n=1 Tax=Paenibacillus sp. OV219 TaxID=1884377 RepID=UPI0008D5F57F|nr:glycosyltransferase [Paenibacillus sp. OV219]SEN61653.1 Glycosyltransferase involved in cell wall bisynthesis [Paenibacillus sp. OV219]